MATTLTPRRWGYREKVLSKHATNQSQVQCLNHSASQPLLKDGGEGGPEGRGRKINDRSQSWFFDTEASLATSQVTDPASPSGYTA